MPRKPKGVEEFEKLLRPLSKVAKPELDREAAKYQARKAKKRKRKS
jgi:hypothetical protein